LSFMINLLKESLRTNIYPQYKRLLSKVCSKRDTARGMSPPQYTFP